MSAPVLQFERVTKQYRGFRAPVVKALDEFSLEVRQGEIFGFLGPNGAGKTTAIHLALGFMRATSGRGTMLGAPFGEAQTRSRVGFLAENVALCHRSAGDVVRFYGELNGVSRGVLGARTREMLELVGLTEVSSRNLKKFSRGMVQRVGLAQALINNPELLILDEPTSALDPVARAMVRDVLLEARRAGKTIFLSSHLLSEIEAVCDRLAIIIRGRVARMGTTAELLESSGQYEVVFRGAKLSDPRCVPCTDGLLRADVGAGEQRRFIENVWSAGGEVVSVTPARRSLEEVFLELTKQSSGESA